MLEPFNVASPSVAVTVAFLLMVKLFLPSNSTFLPLTVPIIVAVSCATTLALPSSAITVPATSAFSAVTVTLFLPVKLPVAVLVNFSVAVTPTLPSVAATVPLLVMLFPVKATSPFVDFTVEPTSVVKSFVAAKVTLFFADKSAFSFTVRSCVALTVNVPSFETTLPAISASFALISTAFFAAKLPSAVFVKVPVALTLTSPSFATTVPALVIVSPDNLASPVFAVTKLSLAISKVLSAVKLTTPPLISPAIVASSAFTSTFAFASKIPLSVLTKVSSALTVRLPSSALISPSLRAFLALTSTLLPVRLPVSVLVKFSFAVTPTLPVSALTVPLLVIVLPSSVAFCLAFTVPFCSMLEPFNVASPSVAVT
nr:hypothetical protein BV115_01662 [Haemophilus influenzae]